MKTVLIVVALVLVAVVGLGFYRGWFGVSSSNDESKSNVTLSVDKDKIETDRDDAVEKAQDLFSSSNDESKSSVTLPVDKDKIETDRDDAVEKAQDLGHEAADKMSPSPEKAQR